jgi:hypothetical protein
MLALLVFPLLFPTLASAVVGGYADYNNYRYQLANSAIDADLVNFTDVFDGGSGCSCAAEGMEHFISGCI